MTHTPCIGLIVPPAEGLVPADGPLLYGERYRFIARGLGISAVSPAGFDPVVDTVLQRARELRQAGAQAISLMGTSISFYRGPEFTQGLRQSMEDATGVPCTTMSHAVVRALQQLGMRRVAVATAYIDALNRKLVDYLTACGFQVTAIQGLDITGVEAVGQVTTQTLVALGERVWRSSEGGADGLFISCGGLQTLDAIWTLEDRLGVPVTASSPAGFWDAVRLGGWPAQVQGFGRLFTTSGATGGSH